MVDDKRFLRSDEEPKEDQPQSERIPIELPEIEYPSQKESPPKEIKKEIPKEEKAPPPPPPEELEEHKKPEPRPRVIQKRRPVSKGWMLISMLILAVSICWNTYLYYNTFELEKTIGSNTTAVEEALIEKEKALKEREFLKESLQKEIDRTKGELAAIEGSSEGLIAQNKQLQADLADYKETHSKLQGEIDKYTKEIEELAATRVGYHKAYTKEKANTKKLQVTIKELEDELGVLKDEYGSIDEEGREKESSHIYDMAFLYMKAGMYDKAIDNFKKYMELNGEDANVHYNIALIYDEVKKDRYKAVDHYNKYLSLKPDAEDLYEVKLKVASLKRTEKKMKDSSKKFKINLDNLKY